MASFTDSATPPRTWPINVSGASVQAVANALHVNLYRLLTGRLEDMVALVRDRSRLAEIGLVLATDREGDRPALGSDDAEKLAEATIEALPEIFSDPAGKAMCRGVLATARRIIDREAVQAQLAAADEMQAHDLRAAMVANVEVQSPEPETTIEDQ